MKKNTMTYPVKIWTYTLLAVLVLLMAPESVLAGREEAQTHVQSGNKAFLQSDYELAEYYFSQAIEEDSSWSVPYNNRGLSRFKRGLFGQAVADLTQALDIKADYAAAHLNRGKCYAAQKNFSAAEADFKAGLDLGQNLDNFLYNLGWIYDEQGEYVKAAGQYQSALSVNPEHIKAKLGLAVTLAKQNRTDEAETKFYEVITQANTGDFNTQLAAYNLGLMRGPGVDFSSDQAASSFQQGIFLFSTDQFETAATKFQDAADLEPGQAHVSWFKHWSYLRRGLIDQASACLREAEGLMEKISVRTLTPQGLVYVDGIKKATSPGTFHLFPGEYDFSVRLEDWPDKMEWIGRIYTDGTAGGDYEMLLDTGPVSAYTAFGPVTDTDRDWLTDVWEYDLLGGLGYGPAQDETDHDSLINLKEHRTLADPTMADTDGDGVSDAEELAKYGTDPSFANTFYYVNDGSTSNDVYCTAVGSSANNGLSPAAPKAGLQEIVDAYDLEPGAVVLVDTGTWSLTSSITIPKEDSGSGRSPVIIKGSTRENGTVLDRNSDEADASCISVGTEVKQLVIENFVFTGARAGTGLIGNEYLTTLRVRYCRAHGNQTGFNISGIMEHCLAYDNDIGLKGTTYSTPRVYNSTFANNKDTGLSVTKGTYKNNIIYSSLSGSLCVGLPFYISITSDYNNIYAAGGALLGRQYDVECSTLACWQERSGLEAHSINQDPLFADPAQGDFHLKSQGGRYAGGQWTTDGTTSPCIDNGASYIDQDREPSPNGGRINMGFYGGSVQASKSRPGRKIEMTDPPEDGVAVSGPVPIDWKAFGAGWTDTYTVGVEYSPDNGTTWKQAASGLAPSSGRFLWDTTRAQPARGPDFLLRIFCEQDRTATDQSASTFSLYNQTTKYYVNNYSTSEDIWCSAVGLDGPGRGFDPSTPAASVQFILDTYDLKPGDTVYIDTGEYLLSSNIEVTAGDSGSPVSPVTFTGSPRGVIINRNDTASSSVAWRLNGCQYITITTSSYDNYPDRNRKFMQFTGGVNGISAEFISGVVIERLELTGNNSKGLGVEKSTAVTIKNNLVTGNGGFGISIGYSDHITVQGNTIYGNGDYELNVWQVDQPDFRNNIIWADGDRDYCIWSDFSAFKSCDFNLYHTTNQAKVGFYDKDENLSVTLADWQSKTGFDTHGLAGDPLFVDAAGGDFHLSSTLGSYHDGEWTNDAQDSPGLDKGRPGDDFSAEPDPNGGRINLGAYGGSEWASKSQSTDTDGDGLIDSVEALGCTDPADADTDDDGLLDGQEDFNHDTQTDEYETDPCQVDTDGDGLLDGLEKGLTLNDIGADTKTEVFQPDLDPNDVTDPTDADTDDDGLTDGSEDANHNGRVDQGETDPTNPDTDGDGIQDGTELGLTADDVGDDTDLDVFQPDMDPDSTTDPLDADSDDDGVPDGQEDPNHNGWIEPGEWDPNDPHSKPGRNLPWLLLLI